MAGKDNPLDTVEYRARKAMPEGVHTAQEVEDEVRRKWRTPLNTETEFVIFRKIEIPGCLLQKE
jgi:hypothetical protein